MKGGFSKQGTRPINLELDALKRNVDVKNVQLFSFALKALFQMFIFLWEMGFQCGLIVAAFFNCSKFHWQQPTEEFQSISRIFWFLCNGWGYWMKEKDPVHRSYWIELTTTTKNDSLFQESAKESSRYVVFRHCWLETMFNRLIKLGFVLSFFSVACVWKTVSSQTKVAALWIQTLTLNYSISSRV